MKKIGIVTFYESDNYGTCLQAFALNHIVNNMGYKAEIVNYKRASITSQPFLSKLKNIGIVRSFSLFMSKKQRALRRQSFSEFRKAFLPICDKRYTEENLASANEGYDAFICGSDMVWSLESKELFDVYFLKFADAKKRIAYAPSFGNMEFSEEEKTIYNEKLKGFEHLSCRERSGVDFIEALTKQKCHFVLDPTLLLKKDEWLNILKLDISNSNRQNKPRVLSYMFGGLTSNMEKTLKKALGNNYNLKYIPNTLSEYKKASISNVSDFGPLGFVKQYAEADKIVTNTYHGLIFAIIFNKPFVLVHRPKGEHWAMHEERMSSFLKTFGLEEHYVYDDQEITEETFNIDYDMVNKIIDEYRQNSLKYLSESLIESTKNIGEN